MQKCLDPHHRARWTAMCLVSLGADPRRYTSFVATLLAISAISCISTAQQGSTTPNPAWIQDAFIHSHHSSGTYGPEWDEQVLAVRPDVMQFHAHDSGAELARKF